MYIYIIYIYVFHYSIAKLPIPPSHPPAGHCSAKSSNSLRFFRRSASAKAARRCGGDAAADVGRGHSEVHREGVEVALQVMVPW